MMTDIQAVTLDVGGTLLRPRPSVGHVYARVARRCRGVDVDPDELNRRFERAWSATSSFQYRRADWAELVAAVFRGLIEDSRDPRLFDELYQEFAEPDPWAVYEDARPALGALAEAGVRLGVLSNWDERLRPLLAALGLADVFEEALISVEIGAQKPDPAIFLEAARRFGLTPGQILHVGDRAREDYHGARSAGLRGLWLRRTGRTDVSKDCVRSLTDIKLALQH